MTPMTRIVNFAKKHLRFQAISVGILAIFIFFIYVSLARILAITWIAYFASQSESTLQEINEDLRSFLPLFYGVSHGFFLLLWVSFSKQDSLKSIFLHFINRAKTGVSAFSFISQGLLLSIGSTLILWSLGFYRAVGSLIQYESAFTGFFIVCLKILGLTLFAFVEEWFFRTKVEPAFSSGLKSRTAAIALTALSMGVLKLIQFNLSEWNTIGVFIFYLWIGIHRLKGAEYPKTFTLTVSTLTPFLLIFGLSLFGSDFGGIFSFVPQIPSLQGFGNIFLTHSDWFHGGTDGPLASPFFQLILILDILRKGFSR